jgi:hypothetical protein
MTRQAFSVEEIRRRTEVSVDRRWNERILATVERQVRRRRLVRRVSIGTLGVTAGLLLGVVAWWRWAPGQGQVGPIPTSLASRASQPAAAEIIRFDEGATGRLVSTRSWAAVSQRSTGHTTVTVRAGAVLFEVEHTGREFRVEAGPVHVIVVGTAFGVDRRDDGSRVSVRRGRVRVETDGGDAVVLSTGEERWFPNPASVAAPTDEPAVAFRLGTSAPKQRVTPRWRVLAQRGDFTRAYKLLGRPGERPRDDVEDLLLAADVSRRSSHFAEAIPYYDRVIREHDRDPRAALAALTKGRITLHQLGRPFDAAAAFAKARALSLPEALAEDAMAGEVVAWHRAGEPAKARQVAGEYVKQYPAGASIANVKRLGGLK